MIEAGAAVQEYHGRPLTHAGTVRHESRAFDVEEESYPVDSHPHALPPGPSMSRALTRPARWFDEQKAGTVSVTSY